MIIKKKRKPVEKTQLVTALDYHRNGISGLGFHVGIVKDTDEDGTREMLVIRFPEDEADRQTGAVVCAAFDLAKLDEREIRSFHNSWRGDHYHEAMDAAIKQEADDRDAKRVAEQRERFLALQVPL
jgi:hypothetical protein